MNNFIIKHKKLFIVLPLIVGILLATTAVTFINKPKLKEVSEIKTCSKPTGKIVAKGIDVSSYQMEIDFQKVKSDGYDFVILRAGTGLGKDKYFDKYYDQATKAGLDIGCYFYSYATTVEEAEEEAKTTIKYIKGKKFNYPVFYDFEYPELLSNDRIELNTQMIFAFCDIIKASGYYPGLYLSSSVYRDFVDTALINENLDVWIAEYGDYSGVDRENFSHNFSMWQYSDRGIVNGISANVDMNYVYVDYPVVVNEFYNKYNDIK